MEQSKRSWDKAFSRGASSMAIGIMIMLIVMVIRVSDFGPFKYMIMLDNMLLDKLSVSMGLPKPLNQSFKPVIFVDIDKETMNLRNYPFGSKTPRSLQAELLKTVRNAGAAVVFVDIDVRDSLSNDDDGILRSELKRHNFSPVIIPRILYSEDSLSCEKQARIREDRLPVEYPNSFDDVIDNVNVFIAHVYHENSFGIADGICSGYNVDPDGLKRNTTIINIESNSKKKYIPAASLLAIELAGIKSPEIEQTGLGSNHEPHLLPLQFRVDSKCEYWPDSAPYYYHRIPAWKVLKARDISVIKDAIVIIGVSYPGSGDRRLTPLDDMPGALIHANMIIQLQIGFIEEPQWWIEMGLEVVSIFINSFILIIFLYYPVYWFRDRICARQSLISKMKYRIKYIFIVIFVPFMVIILTISYFLLANMLAFPQFRRFSILLPISCLIVGLFVEYCYKKMEKCFKVFYSGCLFTMRRVRGLFCARSFSDSVQSENKAISINSRGDKK
jgi:CHASE2 domain-containing sensor protein